MPYHQLVGLNTVEQHGASPNDAQLISRLSVWQCPLTVISGQCLIPLPMAARRTSAAATTWTVHTEEPCHVLLSSNIDPIFQSSRSTETRTARPQ